MELTVATMEWDRKRGFDLVWPLKKVEVNDGMDDFEREAGIMRNLFLKWIGTKEKDRLKEERRRKKKASLSGN